MLGCLLALAWAYLFWISAAMSMGGMNMSGFRMIPAGFAWMAPAAMPWSALELALVFLMWTVMMIGMMTPSATPMLLIYARVARQAVAQNKPFAATAWFAAGYVLAWIAFSLIATALQWWLDRAALLNPAMAVVNARVGAAVLIAAGIYQWTSIKGACLQYCRSPLAFIQRHGGFRPDALGALQVGTRHGIYCVGCCWTIMLLLFIGGVMNVIWIAGIAGLVLLEKLAPFGRGLARVAGAGLVVAGAWLWSTSVG